MARILFFSCEPGGAEVLIPVIRLVQSYGYEAFVLSHGYASEHFRKSSITFQEMLPGDTDVRRALHNVAPGYVITSATSLPERDMTEKYFWEVARETGIGTLAFIDQWQNYSKRFSGIGVRDHLRYLPDHINCIDETGRQEMIKEGFPPERLRTFGHPSLARIASSYAEVNRNATLSAIGLASCVFNRKETLIFVSEPLFEHYGITRGYHQYDVLEYFLENVIQRRGEAIVLIKMHPKDTPAKFTDIISYFKEIEIHVVRNELTAVECLSLSNRIFGMTSIMLIEAFLLGKTVVSLQPGLKINDPLVLSRHGMITMLDKRTDFDPFCFESGRFSVIRVNFDESGFCEFIKGRVGVVSLRSPGKGLCSS